MISSYHRLHPPVVCQSNSKLPAANIFCANQEPMWPWKTACQMASQIWTLHWTLTLNTVFYVYMIWLTYLKKGEFGYISARIDLISSELWNGVWELGFRSCLVNAEKEAVQDTVKDILYRTSTPSFFWLKKYLLFFCKPESTMWSSIHLLIQSWIFTRNQWATYG